MYSCLEVNELCLKVVRERMWAVTSSSMDVDHSMFTIIIKFKLTKLKVLESKLQGFFVFFVFFLLCLFVHLFFSFHVSKIDHASSCDYEKLQVQTHFPSC